MAQSEKQLRERDILRKSLVLFITITALLAGCATSTAGSASSQVPASVAESQASESQKDISIETIAEDNNARIGEYQNTYALPPSGGFSIESVKYAPEFSVGDQTLNNVVAIEVVSDYDAIKSFLNDAATAQLFDDQANEFININSGAYNDTDNDKVFMVFYSDEDISNYKYFVLGGLDSSKNEGKTRLIYKID